MSRQLQVQSGVAVAEWHGNGSMPVPPDDSWLFIDVTDRAEADAHVGMLYDAASDTFSPAPVPQKTRVTKSQVVSVLTPQEWANANSSTDADVVWGMAQFNLADYVDLADPRFNQIFGALIAKGIIASTRSAQILTDLQALANA
jgi:hypothetical protein